MTLRSLAIATAALAVAACSSSTPTPEPSMDAGMNMDSGQAMGDASTGDTGAVTGKPATPQVLSVEKMAGALHVTWKLNDTGLSGVALMRNKDGGDFAKTTLPGTATSQHDTTANTAGVYCYKVMTTRAGVDSDESNQMCGSP